MDSIILFWIIFSLIPAIIASKKGRSFIGYFLLALILSPLLTLIIVLIIDDKQEGIEKKALASGKKKCPKCAELVQIDAQICKHCGSELPAPGFARVCPNCNAGVGLQAERCTNCGSSIA